MKIIFAATPMAGFLNPILAIARMTMDRGDEAHVMTATHLQSHIEKAGARFLPLAPGADIDASRIDDIFPDTHALPPGPEKLRSIVGHMVLDPLPAQLASLRTVLARERPDIVVTNSAFMGRAALFLDPARPPVPLVSCGVSFLALDRPDGAPHSLGLPPTTDPVTRVHYAEITSEANAKFHQPFQADIDAALAALELPPLPCSFSASIVLLADAYLQPTVPAFEYDYGPLPAHVRFVGALPPPPPRAEPLPDWWSELDNGKPVVLVTQGTVANADFSELIEPTLSALADREDLLVIVTTGGRAPETIRGPVPANARFGRYLDFTALLPRLSMLVTNGGYGTVQLALRAGVPIVAAGRTEDKAEVGARVAWSGVGVQIPEQRPSVDELRNAIERVLSNPSYRERAKAIAADMAAIDTRAEILGVFDELVARSPR